MTTTLKRGLAALVAITIMLTGAVVAASPAASSTAQPSIPLLTNIRTGVNAGFDRIVLDLTNGTRPEVLSQVWVDELIEDPTGDIFWLTGENFFSVSVQPARTYDDNNNPTYPGPDRFRTRNLRNVMAVGITGDFEALLSIGIGTRHRSWARVFTLTSPNRVVIDIGH